MGMIDGRGHWYRWDKKDTTESYLALDMAPFARSVDLTRRRVGWWYWQWSSGRKASIAYIVEPDKGVCLHYTASGQSYDYLVRVDTTTPHYGGVRYWWLCPACGRRCRILYGGCRFLCRQCHDLTYETTQSGGDLLHTVDNRLVAIRRKLKSTGHFLDGPWPKPKYMHWDTYGRLCREYLNLLEMRERLTTYELLDLVGTFKPDNDIPITADDYLQDLKDEWEHHKAHPDRPPLRALRSAQWFEEETPQKSDNRLTLGEVAKRAGVPYEFAKEAQAEELIRPDQGRDTRRKRYRQRLASWLQKLYTLRDGGMEWAEIRAWTQRRWQPGHEHERRWPEGYCDG